MLMPRFDPREQNDPAEVLQYLFTGLKKEVLLAHFDVDGLQIAMSSDCSYKSLPAFFVIIVEGDNVGS